MKNRAKCKLCNTIIESFHSTDYVMCKCGEIAVDGGEAQRCVANDFANFLRVDDQGNEIVVTVIEREVENELLTKRPSKKELLEMLDEMVKNIENLPQNALTLSITHYDLWSALALISQIFKTKK
jgi:hypothetical protein